MSRLHDAYVTKHLSYEVSIVIKPLLLYTSGTLRNTTSNPWAAPDHGVKALQKTGFWVTVGGPSRWRPYATTRPSAGRLARGDRIDMIPISSYVM